MADAATSNGEMRHAGDARGRETGARPPGIRTASNGERRHFPVRNGVTIIVLYNEDCPTTPKTVELIRKCVSEMKVAAQLRQVLVRTQEEADAWRFLGSPTVQVDGVDIEPAVRASRNFGFM